MSVAAFLGLIAICCFVSDGATSEEMKTIVDHQISDNKIILAQGSTGGKIGRRSKPISGATKKKTNRKERKSTNKNTRRRKKQTFRYPKSRGYAIDRCIHVGSQCDQLAADYFCRTKGFRQAEKFEWQYLSRTWVLGDGTICTPAKYFACGGFSLIICKR